MDPDSRLWTLNPYENNRVPHPINPEDTRIIQTTGRILEPELQCTICLDILRNTRTTKECLHRFCEECITTALRRGTKNCPNCRTKLVSMRSLRPDPLFDRLIRTIFPNLGAIDEQQAALLAKIEKNLPDKRGAGAGTTADPAEELDVDITGDIADSNEMPVVSMELRAHKRKMIGGGHGDIVKRWKPSTRYVRVDGNAKVDHLCRFILTRLMVEGHINFSGELEPREVEKVEIYISPSSNEFHLVPRNLTLLKVHELYWNIARPMKFCFNINGNIRLN